MFRLRACIRWLRALVTRDWAEECYWRGQLPDVPCLAFPRAGLRLVLATSRGGSLRPLRKHSARDLEFGTASQSLGLGRTPGYRGDLSGRQKAMLRRVDTQSRVIRYLCVLRTGTSDFYGHTPSARVHVDVETGKINTPDLRAQFVKDIFKALLIQPSNVLTYPVQLVSVIMLAKRSVRDEDEKAASHLERWIFYLLPSWLACVFAVFFPLVNWEEFWRACHDEGGISNVEMWLPFVTFTTISMVEVLRKQRMATAYFQELARRELRINDAGENTTTSLPINAHKLIMLKQLALVQQSKLRRSLFRDLNHVLDGEGFLKALIWTYITENFKGNWHHVTDEQKGDFLIRGSPIFNSIRCRTNLFRVLDLVEAAKSADSSLVSIIKLGEQAEAHVNPKLASVLEETEWATLSELAPSQSELAASHKVAKVHVAVKQLPPVSEPAEATEETAWATPSELGASPEVSSPAPMSPALSKTHKAASLAPPSELVEAHEASLGATLPELAATPPELAEPHEDGQSQSPHGPRKAPQRAATMQRLPVPQPREALRARPQLSQTPRSQVVFAEDDRRQQPSPRPSAAQPREASGSEGDCSQKPCPGQLVPPRPADDCWRRWSTPPSTRAREDLPRPPDDRRQQPSPRPSAAQPREASGPEGECSQKPRPGLLAPPRPADDCWRRSPTPPSERAREDECSQKCNAARVKLSPSPRPARGVHRWLYPPEAQGWQHKRRGPLEEADKWDKEAFTHVEAAGKADKGAFTLAEEADKADKEAFTLAEEAGKADKEAFTLAEEADKADKEAFTLAQEAGKEPADDRSPRSQRSGAASSRATPLARAADDRSPRSQHSSAASPWGTAMAPTRSESRAAEDRSRGSSPASPSPGVKNLIARFQAKEASRTPPPPSSRTPPPVGQRPDPAQGAKCKSTSQSSPTSWARPPPASWASAPPPACRASMPAPTPPPGARPGESAGTARPPPASWASAPPPASRASMPAPTPPPGARPGESAGTASSTGSGGSTGRMPPVLPRAASLKQDRVCEAESSSAWPAGTPPPGSTTPQESMALLRPPPPALKVHDRLDAGVAPSSPSVSWKDPEVCAPPVSRDPEVCSPPAISPCDGWEAPERSPASEPTLQRLAGGKPLLPGIAAKGGMAMAPAKSLTHFPQAKLMTLPLLDGHGTPDGDEDAPTQMRSAASAPMVGRGEQSPHNMISSDTFSPGGFSSPCSPPPSTPDDILATVDLGMLIQMLNLIYPKHFGEGGLVRHPDHPKWPILIDRQACAIRVDHYVKKNFVLCVLLAIMPRIYMWKISGGTTVGELLWPSASILGNLLVHLSMLSIFVCAWLICRALDSAARDMVTFMESLLILQRFVRRSPNLDSLKKYNRIIDNMYDEVWKGPERSGYQKLYCSDEAESCQWAISFYECVSRDYTPLLQLELGGMAELRLWWTLRKHIIVSFISGQVILELCTMFVSVLCFILLALVVVTIVAWRSVRGVDFWRVSALLFMTVKLMEVLHVGVQVNACMNYDSTRLQQVKNAVFVARKQSVDGLLRIAFISSLMETIDRRVNAVRVFGVVANYELQAKILSLILSGVLSGAVKFLENRWRQGA